MNSKEVHIIVILTRKEKTNPRMHLSAKSNSTSIQIYNDEIKEASS